MASLKDRILKTRQGLATASSEELSAQAGRAMPSIQPKETKTLGGTPDQAKMAGTPAQKTSAIRLGIQEQNDLSTAVRRGAGRRTEATDTEKGTMSRAERLEGLGSLGERVQQRADQIFTDEMAEANRMNQLMGTGAELGADTGDEELDALLLQLRDNPEDPATIKQINTKLGRAGTEEQLSAAEILNRFDAEGAVAAELGNTVQDAITAGELPLEEMGFTDTADLASLLGVVPEALSEMSVDELIQQVDTQIQQEYSQTEELQQRVNDPRLGPAERAEARKQLRDLGAVGVKSAESDIDKLYDQIAEADTVEFNGEQVQVEELLSDDYMSGVVANYLDGLDPDTGLPITDFSKELAKSQPELAKFIKNNKAVLDAASEGIEDGVKEFAQVQQANKQLASGVGAEPLDDAMMESLFPGWGDMTTEQYSAEDFGFLSVLNDPQTTTEEANQLVKTAKMIHKADPKLWKQFAKLDYGDLQQLGALDDPAAYSKFRNKIKESRDIQHIETEEDLARFFDMPFEELETLGTELTTAVNMGVISSDMLDKIPGLAEGDWGLVTKYLQEQTPDTMQDFLSDMETVGSKLSKIKQSLSEVPELPNDLNKAFVNDDSIDLEELQEMGGDLAEDDLILLRTEYYDSLDNEAKQELDRQGRLALKGQMDSIIDEELGQGEFKAITERFKNEDYETVEDYQQDIIAFQKLLPSLRMAVADSPFQGRYAAQFMIGLDNAIKSLEEKRDTLRNAVPEEEAAPTNTTTGGGSGDLFDLDSPRTFRSFQ